MWHLTAIQLALVGHYLGLKVLGVVVGSAVLMTALHPEARRMVRGIVEYWDYDAEKR